MKITMSEPDGPYSAELDPGVMQVEITECFNGIGMVTADGERIGISMRDTGFEFLYDQGTGTPTQHWEFKGGQARRLDPHAWAPEPPPDAPDTSAVGG